MCETGGLSELLFLPVVVFESGGAGAPMAPSPPTQCGLRGCPFGSPSSIRRPLPVLGHLDTVALASVRYCCGSAFFCALWLLVVASPREPLWPSPPLTESVGQGGSPLQCSGLRSSVMRLCANPLLSCTSTSVSTRCAAEGACRLRRLLVPLRCSCEGWAPLASYRVWCVG